MAVVMRRASWFQLSGFPKESQNTVKDLLFEGTKLFWQHGQFFVNVKGLQGPLCVLWGIYNLPTRESLVSPREHRNPFSSNYWALRYEAQCKRQVPEKTTAHFWASRSLMGWLRSWATIPIHTNCNGSPALLPLASASTVSDGLRSLSVWIGTFWR